MNERKTIQKLKDPKSLFSFFMFLVTIHSLIVGIALIFSPSSIFEFFGYKRITEQFFHVQGGVFHLVMSMGYAIAALKPTRFEGVIIFSIAAKFTAVLFLTTYSIFIEFIPVVFLSGIGDLIMGILILILYKNFKKSKKE